MVKIHSLAPKGLVMAQVCPIIFRNIDGTISRLNALSTSFIIIAFMLTHHFAFLYLLGFDFMIRVYGSKKFSPFFNISKFLKSVFSMKTMMVDAGAKRVAAQFGLFFILLLLLTSYLDLYVLADVISIIFLACTALEFLFAYCVGCEIYYLIQKLR